MMRKSKRSALDVSFRRSRTGGDAAQNFGQSLLLHSFNILSPASHESAMLNGEGPRGPVGGMAAKRRASGGSTTEVKPGGNWKALRKVRQSRLDDFNGRRCPC